MNLLLTIQLHQVGLCYIIAGIPESDISSKNELESLHVLRCDREKVSSKLYGLKHKSLIPGTYTTAQAGIQI